jgi:hypothetical protein
MSKYDPLFQHLDQSRSTVELSFADVEELLGFPLPTSAYRYAAWWSNSGGTHVQSAAWQAAGFRTEQVDMDAKTVRFVRDKMGFSEMKQAQIKPSAAPNGQKLREEEHHPAYGALKGMITILPGVDLTEPTYADWKKLYGEDK